LALGSSSLGIPLLLAAALEVLGRADRGRRWRVVAVPALIYVAWYVVYGVSAGATLDNVFAAPAYVADAAANAAGALAGLELDWGRSLLVALLAGFVLLLRRGGAAPWRVAALAAAPLLFWGLTALARADDGDPGAARYLYPGVLLLTLLGVEAARGLRPTRASLAVVVAVLGIVTLSNLDALRKQAGFLRDQTTIVVGAVSATEIAGNRVGPEFQPSPDQAPQIRAGRYLEAVREDGSPALTPLELSRTYAAGRAAADTALVRGYNLALAGGSAAAGPAPEAEPADSASVTPEDGCLRVAARSPGAAVRVTVPPGGLLVDPGRARATVAVRRWADSYSPLGAGTASGAPAVLRIPADRGGAPWRAEVRVDATARLCGVGP